MMLAATGRQMKPTNLEWLGMIPEDWDERSIGRETWVRARLGWKGLTAGEYVEEGIPMLATPNIKRRDLDFASAARISKERYDESPEIMLGVGDVLLTKDGSTIGIVNMVRELQEPATVNGSIAVITPTGELNGRFLYWVIASQYAQSIFNRLRDGMGVPHLFQRDINRIAIPFPPVSEQQAIADYLDYETQRIDELITEQRGLIETLRERRMAVIDAEVLPADLEEWNEMPLRYSLTFQEGPGIGAVDFRDSGVPLLRISSIRGSVATLEGVNYLDPEKVARHWNHFRVEAGDLLINSSASMGSVAEVLDGEVVGGIPYTGIIKIRPGLMTKGFARWYFQSRAFLGAIDLLKTGSTIQHYGPSHLRQLRVFLPQAERQEEIVERLTHAVAHADALIAESEDLIALSQERRAALITAAVTGQIDLRTAA